MYVKRRLKKKTHKKKSMRSIPTFTWLGSPHTSDMSNAKPKQRGRAGRPKLFRAWQAVAG